MARGLIWLPLLGLFIWLTWTGWKEYQKVEGYRIWSEKFDKAKYDIYAVIGQKGNTISWGKPTSKGILDLQTFSLKDVGEINLLIKDQVADWNNSENQGKAYLEFKLIQGSESIEIPFTDSRIASQWGQYLLSLANNP